MADSNSICVMIPTLNGERHIDLLLKQLSDQIPPVEVVLIDSGSADATLAIADKHKIKVIAIQNTDFNHGATREMARHSIKSDYVVFLTQDAIPEDLHLVNNLVEPLLGDADIAVSYGRQIAHHGADIFEAFPRAFNYGNEAQVRTLNDLERYGVYTFFCSNSCAAWRNSALDMVGGFDAVLTNEDYFAVAKLLQHGFKIAYVPDAVVRHSHRYSLKEEFKRYFDTGYVRAERPEIQVMAGQAERRGAGFFKALIRLLIGQAPHLVPYAIIQTAVKWFGFRLGYYGRFMPVWMRTQLSQQSYYWSSRFFQER